LERKYLNLAG